MKAIIISIGDELLIGQVVNTNAAFIAELFSEIGIEITRMITVADGETEILNSFQDNYDKCDIITVTGGLGPTHDDITKNIICKFFNTDLIVNEAALDNIKNIMQSRNLPMTKVAEEQALVPRGAIAIPNDHGTAPGILFERENRIFIAMPGVPFEMEGMIDNFVIPYLKKKSLDNIIVHRTLKTTGIPESLLSAKLGNPDFFLKGAKLAFLPSPRGVRLRISVVEKTRPDAEKKIKIIENYIREKVAEYIYGTEKEEIEEVIGKLLTEKKLTLAIAESCTGGLIANRITNVPGSSAYLENAVVAYSNQSKINLLGVQNKLITAHGAVSKEVAEAMAEGTRQKASTSIGISTTGIAGPSGGTPTKPIGLVWIGYSDSVETFAKEYRFHGDRLRIKERATQAALELLRKKLKDTK
jgi:nicotinamide-nucleotide amidase